MLFVNYYFYHDDYLNPIIANSLIIYSRLRFFERLTKFQSNQGTRFLVLTCIFLIGAAISIQEIIKDLIATHRLLTSLKRSKLDREKIDKKIDLGEVTFFIILK